MKKVERKVYYLLERGDRYVSLEEILEESTNQKKEVVLKISFKY